MRNLWRAGRQLAMLVAGFLGPLLPVVGADLNVFAAASLAEALREIAPPFEQQSGVRVRFNFGSSGLLARQIGAGAPADVFFSADEGRMDALVNVGRIRLDTRRTLLSNALVIIVPEAAPAGSVVSPADLADGRVRRIALGEMQTVPAGIYAREYLQGLGLWSAIAPKVVPMENVRAALSAVGAGNADAGIVYRTDVRMSARVRVAFEVPEAEGPKIAYLVAVVEGAREEEAARAWVAYLAAQQAQEVFSRHGFGIVR